MATAILAVTAIAGLAERSVARREQKEEQKIRQRTAGLQSARRRRQQVAEARVKRAQTISQGVQQGVGEGSSVAGATGSLSAQLASNIGFSQQLEQAGIQSFRRGERAASHLGRADLFTTVGSLASTFMPGPTQNTGGA